MDHIDLEAFDLIRNDFIKNNLMNVNDDLLPIKEINPEIKDLIYELAENNQKINKHLFNAVIKSDSYLIKYLNDEYEKYFLN